MSTTEPTQPATSTGPTVPTTDRRRWVGLVGISLAVALINMGILTWLQIPLVVTWGILAFVTACRSISRSMQYFPFSRALIQSRPLTKS